MLHEGKTLLQKLSFARDNETNFNRVKKYMKEILDVFPVTERRNSFHI